jgi:DNA-binding NarL/FixJ family response regulator
MSESIRVALVNDYEIVLEGLRGLLRPHEPEICVVDEAIRSTPDETVDITLFDTYGEHRSMADRVAELAADPTNGAIIVFSFSDQPFAVRRAVGAGAKGFISKASPGAKIIEGIRAAAGGEHVTLTSRAQRGSVDPVLSWPGRATGLTERESELLALLPTGMTNRELAAQLFVSENTIKTQLRALFAKLGVRNRVQAVTLARDEMGAQMQTRDS